VCGFREGARWGGGGGDGSGPSCESLLHAVDCVCAGDWRVAAQRNRFCTSQSLSAERQSTVCGIGTARHIACSCCFTELARLAATRFALSSFELGPFVKLDFSLTELASRRPASVACSVLVQFAEYNRCRSAAPTSVYIVLSNALKRYSLFVKNTKTECTFPNLRHS